MRRVSNLVIVLAVVMVACALLIAQTDPPMEDVESKASPAPTVRVEQLAEIVDNASGKQVREPWWFVETLKQRQQVTGITNCVIRHPNPVWPLHGGEGDPNARLVLSDPGPGFVAAVNEVGQTYDSIMVYIGSPCATKQWGSMRRPLPGDAVLSEMLMAGDFEGVDAYMGQALAPYVNSAVDVVVFDAQSTVDPNSPWFYVLQSAKRQLRNGSVLMGVESPPHPDAYFDPLRELVDVSGSVYSVAQTNWGNGRTYPPEHELCYVFLTTKPAPEGGWAHADGRLRVEGAELLKARAREFADDPRFVFVAPWEMVAQAVGATTPRKFKEWLAQ